MTTISTATINPAAMSTATAWALITFGAMTAAVGLAMLRASSRRASTTRTRLRRAAADPPVAARTATTTTARPAARTGGPLAGWWGALGCTAVAGGAITAAQWTVLGQTSYAALWAVVLGLPSFLAGATLTRLLILLRAGRQHRRRTRAVRPGRGERR